MKLLGVLFAAVVIQGAVGQQDTFSVEPKVQNIVTEGDEVILECIIREPKTCAWKLKVPEISTVGFLNNQAAFLEKDGIRVRDASSPGTDCSLIIPSVEMRHSGTYTCSPFVDGGQVDGTPAEVIVAVKPASVEITGDQVESFRLTASAAEPTSVTCEARDARPAAELAWFLGETQLTEGVTSSQDTDPDSRLVTSRSTLTHQFGRQDEGLGLRCEASHPAYGAEDQRLATLTVAVQFAPFRAAGSDIGTLYGFTAGQDKDLTVNFTSNPEPTIIEWTVGPGQILEAGQQTTDGRIIASPLEKLDAETHQYALRLTFSPVLAADQNTSFSLFLANNVGRQELTMRVGADAPPPPPPAEPERAAEAGVSGGAIGGIIVAVILLLAIIALVAFARSRGKWCFAAEGGGDTRKEWRAHMDPEAADKEGHDNPGHDNPGHDQKPDPDAAEHHNGTNGSTNGGTKLPTDTPV